MKPEIMEVYNSQGNAVENYTEYEVPFTRIIEHRHFEFGLQHNMVISKEYPREWKWGDEPYYSEDDAKNTKLYLKYKKLAETEEKVVFGCLL